MKILQVVQKPQRRGAEVFAFELSEELTRRGASVRTVYLYGNDGLGDLPQRPDDVSLEGDEKSGLERMPGINPVLLRALSKAIRAFAPDVVQANGSRTVKYTAVAKALGGANWKLVYRNIGLPSHWQTRAHRLWGYRAAIVPQLDGVICVTHYSMADAVALYRLRVPTVVIRNGFDPRKLESENRNGSRGEIPRSPSDFVMLFLGTLSSEKGPDRFLRVLARAGASQRTFRGWIVGDGPMRADLEQLAVELGISDRCEFFGYQSKIAPFLRGADVLLLTSETEGMPAAALEAGYAGVPVIAPRLGGLSECIEDGVTGLLVGGSPEEELPHRLRELAEDETARQHLAMNARARIRERFTIRPVTDDYVAFYHRLLDSPHAPPSRS